MSNIRKIGVIGAGQMGNGIAHVFAQSGYDVVLSDLSQESLDKGLATIGKNMERLVGRGKMSEDEMASAIGRIKTSTNLDDFGDVDLAIESAVENEEIKRKILEDLCPRLSETALIATNTSSISITRLAAITDRPDRFAGMHFMNPVPLMQLVELIRGITTSAETFDAIRELTLKLDKTPVSSEDFPAFMVNRILLPMINEAIYTLYEGVGSVDAIDTAMRLGANHPMGPLQLADFIGLDTCLAIMQVLYDGLADTKYRPCPLLVKYVEAGWVGRKVNRGFYDYTSEVPVPTR
jgi:3-hydroxybutyryl-CoA dehydrogenase